MTHAVDVGLVVSLAGSLLYVLLGAWVLTLSPRRRQTTLLGAFAVLFGLTFAMRDVGAMLDFALGLRVVGGPSAHPIYEVADTLEMVASVIILALAASVPHRLEDRRPLAVALAVAFGLSVVFYGAIFVSFFPDVGWRLNLALARGVVDTGTLWAAAALLPLRAAPSRGLTREETTQLAVLATGFAFFWEFVSGWNIPDVAQEVAAGQVLELTVSVAILGFWLTVAALWGRNMVRADEDTARIHRAAMLIILGLMLAGAVFFAAFPEADPVSGLVAGIARTLAVGVLTYGVLRHDIAGLDAKVEYGVSRTTVAGVFVAVFFVVSEGAQVLFAGFAGSELLGVLAAGALVFFLAPIQRAADRFAAKAVPGGAEAGAGVEARYRQAVETALADGEITADEERHLGRVAERLGIESKRAADLREQVEDEADAGGDAP